MINHSHQMFYGTWDPLHKPLLKQQNVDKAIPINQNTGINLDIEEISPFQEGVTSEQYKDGTKHFFKI